MLPKEYFHWSSSSGLSSNAFHFSMKKTHPQVIWSFQMSVLHPSAPLMKSFLNVLASAIKLLFLHWTSFFIWDSDLNVIGGQLLWQLLRIADLCCKIEACLSETEPVSRTWVTDPLRYIRVICLLSLLWPFVLFTLFCFSTCFPFDSQSSTSLEIFSF